MADRRFQSADLVMIFNSADWVFSDDAGILVSGKCHPHAGAALLPRSEEGPPFPFVFSGGPLPAVKPGATLSLSLQWCHVTAW